MRATRAYLASFGTAGSLLAGAAILFVLASAAVSFHGWPSLGMPRAPVAIVRPAHAAAATPPAPQMHRLLVAARAAGARTAVVAAPAAPLSGAHPLISSAPVSPRAGHRQPGVPRRPAGAKPGPSAPPPRHGGGRSGGGAPAPPTRPVLPTGPLGSLLGNAVRGLTGGVGKTIAGAGAALGAAVGSLGGSLAHAVAPASPQLGRTVSGAGHNLSGTVTGVTGSLGGAVAGVGQGLGSLLGGRSGSGQPRGSAAAPAPADPHHAPAPPRPPAQLAPRPPARLRPRPPARATPSPGSAR